MRTTRTITALTSLALAAALAGGGALAQSDDDVMAPESPMAPGAGLSVVDAWSRPSPMMEGAGAAYLRVMNGTDIDDALIGASSPAAGIVELHQTAADDQGMMSMTPVESIPVPAGGEAVLEPGGYHLMLLELTAPLLEGDTIELTLEFQVAGALSVTADVLGMDASGPGGMGMGESPAPSMEPVADLPTRFTVEAYDSFFQPKTIEAPANTEIKVVLNNYGMLPHNIAFYLEEGGSPISETSIGLVINAEESATTTFVTPGPGEYFIICVVHPQEMTGTLIVR